MKLVCLHNVGSQAQPWRKHPAWSLDRNSNAAGGSTVVRSRADAEISAPNVHPGAEFGRLLLGSVMGPARRAATSRGSGVISKQAPCYPSSIERELSPAGAERRAEFSDSYLDRTFPTQALRSGAAGARAGERLRRARAAVRAAAEDGARRAVDGAHHGFSVRLLRPLAAV